MLETPLTRLIKLAISTVPLEPSLLCTLYIMMCLVYQVNLRRRANRIMIAILTIHLLELVGDLMAISLFFLYKGYTYNLSVCLYWVTGNYAMQGVFVWLTAWASIDRYFLIFIRNPNTFHRHDFPILIFCILVIVWYIVVTLTHACSENWFDATQFLCGGPCFDGDTIAATADWTLIVLLPVLPIVVFNILLLVRVMIQRYGRRLFRRPFQWRQNRKLFIRLLSVSVIYFVTQVPLVILSLVHIFGPPDFLTDISRLWLYYIPYLIYIVTPFGYIATTKECWKRFCNWRHRIEPTGIVQLQRFQPRSLPT